jgi:hypothetical protein
MIAGKNVATINDKNNNDWVTKGAKNSFDINPPTNKLLKSLEKEIVKILQLNL